MTLLGHGVHITPPQPIEEAIAWHTVPAQLSALRKLLRDAERDREAKHDAATSNFNNALLDLTGHLEALRQELLIEVNTIGGRLEQVGQAQFLALQEQVNGLGKYLKDSFILLGRSLDSLDEGQKARLDDERRLTTQRLDAVLKLVEGVDTVHAARNVLLSERIHQLEQAPLKRFWRWLTRKERKNGSTL